MVKFAVYETLYGDICITYDGDKITSIKKFNGNITHRGQCCKLTDIVLKQLNEYFTGERKKFDFPYKVQGTEFQQKVWKALCDIPYGETRSYKEIATIIGNPKASRAVGMANNKNPISIAVPCHRVVGANGKLVGYAGGLEMKKSLLELEQLNKN